MRIVHLVNHTARHNGNVHAAIDLACAQADLGHDVTMCSSGGSFDDVLKAHGVTILLLPQFAKSPKALATALQIRRLVIKNKVDIIHAHMMASAVVGFVASRLTKTRMVTTVHNAFERTAILMGLGDRVISVSQAVGKSMGERGIGPKRLRVVLNGTIGTARYSKILPEPQTLQHPALLYVGGMHDRKGVPELLSAFSIARRTRPDLHLYLVGEGPQTESYNGSLEDADRPAVHFAGSMIDPRSYLIGADALVLASRADPAPLVLSEAREAGLAIIGSDVDGIPELLEGGKAGILVPPQDPDALAEAILTVFESDAVLADHRQRSQINIEKLSLRRVAQETLAVYQEVARRSA